MRCWRILLRKKMLSSRRGQLGSIPRDRQVELDRETSPFVDTSQILGREKEKSEVVKLVLDNSLKATDNFTAIPIVGFGGIGKTALAQLVFEAENVIKHFDVRRWVCVADISNHRTLLREVFRGVCSGGSLGFPTKSHMQEGIMKMLHDKRFLIILDDVWNTEQWEDIRILLKHAHARGSIVIVTTRIGRVAATIGTVSPYHLNQLSDEHCWAIFERTAFEKGGPARKPVLENIGREIVLKCNGVPLAIKDLGRLMHSKRTLAGWSLVNNAKHAKTIGETSIMRSLKLSYDQLALPLRRCFAYCATFPVGSKIFKDDLTLQWAANGLIESSSNDDLEVEEISNEYFQILCSNFFLQKIEENEDSGVVSCEMHKVMHDLASSVAGNKVATAMHDFKLGRTLHLSLYHDNVEDDLSIIEKFDVSEIMLRTCALSTSKTKGRDAWSCLSKFKWLRVLCVIWEEEFPSWIGDFKHLRYLCLESSTVEVLPELICELHLLDTLDVFRCHALKELPESLSKLSNLRHLRLPQRTLPKKLGELRSVQTISPILCIGEEGDGRGIGELEHLSQLRGILRIHEMEKVRSTEHFKKARLNEKENISHLVMKWGNNYQVESDHIEVAEALELPPNLKELRIEGFPGVKLPLESLDQLVDIELVNCNVLEEVTLSRAVRALDTKKCPKFNLISDIGALQIFKMQ